MSRKIVRLTVDHLAALEIPSRSCLFWELDPVRRARVSAQDAAGEKEAWLSEVLREWGSCGRVALVDDRPVGYVVYVPAALAPGAAGLPTAPASPDAVLMTMAYVASHARGGGLGRMLVQGMARDLIERGGIRAVEAFGDTRDGANTPECPDRCVVPAGFLGGVGFKTQRAHGTTPRLRMELRSAVTWRDEVELALDRLLGVVRPRRRVTPQARRSVVDVRGTVTGSRRARRGLAGSAAGLLDLAEPTPSVTSSRTAAQLRNSESSLSRAAFGRAPTMERTTSPPW